MQSEYAHTHYVLENGHRIVFYDSCNFVWDVWDFETARKLYKHLRAVFGTEFAVKVFSPSTKV